MFLNTNLIMINIEELNWTDWKEFPDPRKDEYLYAPFGFGIYQLRNKKTKDLIIFGIGNNCAYRMSSLLPRPIGASGRNAEDKKQYIFENISDIEYRTVPCKNRTELIATEKQIKALNIHKFNR